MTVTDPREAGLDPAHIVAICTEATGGRSTLAVGTHDGISVCLPSQKAAGRARVALTRVGYQVTATSTGRSRDLIVTGWDPDWLDARLTAMRNVAHQLAGYPSVTARAVIDGFRDLPAGTPSAQLGTELLDKARAGLRSWVAARSGIHAPRNPSIVPADAGIALQLRATAVMEEAIEDLIERHLRAAGYAVVLFSSLRQRMDDNRAQATAVRWAGVTFQLSGSAAQDSTPLVRATGRSPGSGASPVSRPGRPVPPGGRRPGAPVTSISPGPDAPAITPGRPAGPGLPASRPRPRR